MTRVKVRPTYSRGDHESSHNYQYAIDDDWFPLSRGPSLEYSDVRSVSGWTLFLSWHCSFSVDGDFQFYYRPLTKLQEGNVFPGVCHSAPEGEEWVGV